MKTATPKPNPNIYELDWNIKKVLISRLRDKTTRQKDFVNTSIRLSNLLWEFTLSNFTDTYVKQKIQTPTTECEGYELDGSKYAIVSVYRSSEAMTSFGPLQWEDGITFAKVLVQRDESDPEKKPIFYYKKFPKNINEKIVFVADPMLGTGGSMSMTIKCLVEAGVPEERICCVNLITCMTGMERVLEEYPKVRFYVAQIDPEMNEEMFLVPGLGDFGDRFYNTE